MTFIRISAGQAKALIDADALIVDIRDPDSYRAGHIDGAVHVTADNVDEFVASSDHTRPLVVCCYHGNASQGAAAYFSGNGFEQTYSLDGGYEAWQQLLAEKDAQGSGALEQDPEQQDPLQKGD